MCDASEHAAGYVLLVEDYSGEEGQESKNCIVSLWFETIHHRANVVNNVGKRLCSHAFSFWWVSTYLVKKEKIYRNND